VRHPQIHEDDVDAGGVAQIDGFPAVGGLPGDLQVGLVDLESAARGGAGGDGAGSVGSVSSGSRSTLITAMWWATTSCSSRAMRRRSSITRRRASSSRACSAWRARSVTSEM
jgi:hypothetical protein